MTTFQANKEVQASHLPVHDARDTNPSSDPNSVPLTHIHPEQAITLPMRWFSLGQAVSSPIWQTTLPVTIYGGGQA